MNTKFIKSLYLLFSLIVMGASLVSCNDKVQDEFPYLFRPVAFGVSLNKTVATISWAAVDSAKSYTLQISSDSLFGSLVVDTTTTALTVASELAGETKFFARVRANASDSARSSFFNSKLSFSTPKENLFTGFGTSINTGTLYSAYMTDVNSLTVKWTPGANVTHLILTSATGGLKDSVEISDAEKTAGVKVVSSLSSAKWKVGIYNKTILRGTTYGQVEGDIIVPAGGDLVTALNSATDGQVVVLAGGTYSVGSSQYIFTKNIKVRSAVPTAKAVICMTSGTPSSTSNMLAVNSAAMDSLVFENIEFNGYCDNSSSSTKIGYLFNNKTATKLNSLKFLNCSLHNFGNTPFRLQGGVNAITNLIFNGCIVYDYGYSSGYAMVNISKSSDKVDNVSILNSTIYNFSYPIISVAQTAVSTGTSMSSVTVTNCTFNQTTQNTAAARVLFTFDYVNIANGINISKCIFGSSGAQTAGIKATNATAVKSVSGSYYCSDYVDETLIGSVSYSIKSLLTSYSKASTDLWVAPLSGNFALKDTGFAGKGSAGDLRWY